MKLPNGYGSVTKLSGNRRKPYLARITLGWSIDESSGKAIQNRINIGTFKTKKEALQALSEYGENPYDIANDNMTVEELYAKWSEAYFPKLSGESSVRTITSAWKYCHELYDMRVKDIRARHIKGIIEDGYVVKNSGSNKGQKVVASPVVKGRIKSLFNLMLDYALEYEIVDRNYARTFDLSSDIVQEKNAAVRSHSIFTDAEMEMLWNNVGSVKYVDWILIQCYMGWRPQELAVIRIDDVNLDERCITGGMKTDAGKNRTVPIHSRILPLVRRNYEYAVAHGSDRLLNDPDGSKAGMRMTYDKYAYRFEKVMVSLGLNECHRPHDPRKTFVTMAKKAGVDDLVIKRLVGHETGDLTEDVYTERDLAWLLNEIEKMP